MIQTYPQFSKLTLNLADEINAFTGQFEPFSDFNFTSLFSWDTDGSAELAWLNNNLVIRLPDYLDGHSVYSLLGRHKIEESVQTLLKKTDKLELVPEMVVSALAGDSAYRITEDPDNFDYIYEVAHLSELAGNKFKKKRNKANVFKKDHENYELVVRVTRQLDKAHAEKLKQVDREWATATPRAKGDILAERKAIDRLLDNFAAFKLVLIEVVVDGEIKAFSINELLDREYSICHFEKALSTHHEHLNTFLTIEVARELQAAGSRLMNWEQDLGLEGLRRSKHSYHPVHMLKKYTVSPK